MNCLTAAVLAALSVLASATADSDQIHVVWSTDSVKIDPSGPIHSSELPNVITALLGLSVPKGSKAWNDLLISDPFSLPKAVIVMDIPETEHPKFNVIEDISHDLLIDSKLDNVYNIVEKRLKNKYLHDKNSKKIQFMNLMPVNQFLPKNHALYKKEEKETNNLHDKDMEINEPHFHWIDMGGIKNRIILNDPTMTLDEQKKIMKDIIHKVMLKYCVLYNDQVFILAITHKNTLKLSRNKRETGQLEEDLNVFEPMDSDYPVIFNLLLWFTLIFVFSLIAISLSIAQMDPGRDSIIYRMTSNRMKKEN